MYLLKLTFLSMMSRKTMVFLLVLSIALSAVLLLGVQKIKNGLEKKALAILFLEQTLWLALDLVIFDYYYI